MTKFKITAITKVDIPQAIIEIKGQWISRLIEEGSPLMSKRIVDFPKEVMQGDPLDITVELTDSGNIQIHQFATNRNSFQYSPFAEKDEKWVQIAKEQTTHK